MTFLISLGNYVSQLHKIHADGRTAKNKEIHHCKDLARTEGTAAESRPREVSQGEARRNRTGVSKHGCRRPLCKRRTKTRYSMSKIPSTLDYTVLEFLEYGDKEMIAAWDRKENNTKTSRAYVSMVCNKKRRNDRILNKAFEVALSKMGRFPKQVIKS